VNKILPQNSDQEVVFKIVNAASFCWQKRDDAFVVFDQRSGHTQVMNELAYEIMDMISEEPLSLSGVYSELEKSLEGPLPEELQNTIRETVEEFDKMGLIEPQ